MKLKRRSSEGFSLLEVLLVIVIMITALVPLLQALSRGLIASDEVKGSNTASFLAQRRLEEIKYFSFSSISSEAKTAVTSYPAYSRQVIVTSREVNLKDVKVIVYWYTGDGSQRSISVETNISNF